MCVRVRVFFSPSDLLCVHLILDAGTDGAKGCEWGVGEGLDKSEACFFLSFSFSKAPQQQQQAQKV